MGLTTWTIANHLKRLSAVYDTYPFYVSVWAYILTSSAEDQVFSIGTDGLTTNIRAGLRSAGSANNTQGYRATTTSEYLTQVATSPNAWHHYGVEAVASNSFAFLLDNANKQTSTTDLTINASNCIYIGQGPALVAGEGWTGYIAEVSIWGGSMTSANMDSLTAKLFNGGAAGAGANPLNVTAEAAQPWSGQLKAYWPLTTVAAGFADASGNGNLLTMMGTLTDAGSHPTIEAVSGGVSDTPIRPPTMVSIVP